MFECRLGLLVVVIIVGSEKNRCYDRLQDIQNMFEGSIYLVHPSGPENGVLRVAEYLMSHSTQQRRYSHLKKKQLNFM